MSAISHIEVAATQGMNAGRQAYVERCSRSGLPTVQAAAKLYKGRRGLARYCAKFGADVDAITGALTRTSPRPTRSSGRTYTPPVLTEREQLLARLAELDAQEAPVVDVRPARASKPQTVKENLWRPWAIRKYGIPTRVGGTFTYVSKKSHKASTHKVVRVTSDGAYTVKVA